MNIVIIFFINGCGRSYYSYMAPSLSRMEHGDYEEAISRIDEPDGLTNKLLYRLERAVIYHYQKHYVLSNQEFERAEVLIDRLYTKSLSRNLISLLTNDAIIAYRGEEFEWILIHYYRAMNYEALGDRESALVECRKANLLLSTHMQKGEYDLSYGNDAFIQYMTGMFYEDEGELNDAYVSYRAAEKGYLAYAESFGTQIPRMLMVDALRLARRLGYSQDVEAYRTRYSLRDNEIQEPIYSEVVIFVEVGFVPRKHQVEYNIPIYKGDRNLPIWTVSDRIKYRYKGSILYRREPIDYWLRIALPEYSDTYSERFHVRVRNGDESVDGVLVEDVEAIARSTLSEKFNHILARTAARAMVKYAASKTVTEAISETEDKEDDEKGLWESLATLFGGIFSIFVSATEAADTRGWLSLPQSIHVVRLPSQNVHSTSVLELLDSMGRVIKVQELPEIKISDHRNTFVNMRVFR